MASEKTIVLITGANSGVGFALASLLIDDPSKHVLLGSRSHDKGTAAVHDLQSRGKPGTVELLVVDVADSDSIDAAAAHVTSTHGRLDALVNNAAVGKTPGTLAQMMARAFAVNATGPLLMGEAFAPLLRKSSGTPRIVNVGSGAGIVSHRMGVNAGNPVAASPWYNASKAALNLVSAEQAMGIGRADGARVFVYSPGFCVSNLGPHNNAANGAQPAEKGAAPMVGIINGERDAEHGMFLRAQGSEAF